MMGQLKLIWSLIQLTLANQHKIVPIRSLIGVSVNIDGLHNVADFKVIEIVDGSTPYPTLLGLDWEFDNHTISDVNKSQMVFKVEDLKVIVPLDPTEGTIFVEPSKRK
jgi:hypothetical protein